VTLEDPGLDDEWVGNDGSEIGDPYFDPYDVGMRNTTIL